MVNLGSCEQNSIFVQVLLALFGCFVAILVGYFTNFIVLLTLFTIAAPGFFRLFLFLRFEPNFCSSLFGS